MYQPQNRKMCVHTLQNRVVRTLEPSWNFKFLDETKTANPSNHLHANVTENVWKRKISWNKWQQSYDSFMKFHHHGILLVRWYTKYIQTSSLVSHYHRSCSSHDKVQGGINVKHVLTINCVTVWVPWKEW